MNALVRNAILAVALSAVTPGLWAEDSLSTLVMPQYSASGSDWVPVVLLAPEPLHPFPLRSSLSGPEGVLLGFLHVSELDAPRAGGNVRRVQMLGQVPIMDGLQLKGMLAGSEFRPCIGIIDQPELAPLRPDLCDSFGQSDAIGGTQVTGLGAQVRISQGWIGVSVQHAQGNDLSLALPSAAPVLLPRPGAFPSTGQLEISPTLTPFSSERLSLEAMLELNSESKLGIGLALARAQIGPSELGSPTRLDQGNLTFTLQQGNLTTQLGTRVVNFPDVSDALPWAGLDLGFSWQLPWQGTISVGAQNLMTHGKPPPLLDPATKDTAETFSRVPYVRYHQDL